jgi:DNA-binding NarL/FixJ family response regulator
MIGVAVVDDHPAVRLGLATAIRSEPGLVASGVAGTAAELAPVLYRNRPDVVLLDYNLPDVDGLTVCRNLKSQVPTPGVILYSAFTDDSMTVPAIVAGADGIVDKGVPARALFEAIREVAGGGAALPRISAELLEAAAVMLDEEDLPILGMLIDRRPPQDIGQTLRLELPALRGRIGRMLARLQPSVGRSRIPLDATTHQAWLRDLPNRAQEPS